MRRRGMGRRAGRPGVLGTVARTAAVAGTATAVVGGVQRHQERKAAEQDAEAQQQADAQQADAQQPAQAEQQAPAQQQAPAPRAPMDESDRLARIKELGEMRDQGLLTDSEFASEKARLLAT